MDQRGFFAQLVTLMAKIASCPFGALRFVECYDGLDEASANLFARISTSGLRAGAVQSLSGSGSIPTRHRSSLSASQQALSAGSTSIDSARCRTSVSALWTMRVQRWRFRRLTGS